MSIQSTAPQSFTCTVTVHVTAPDARKAAQCAAAILRAPHVPFVYRTSGAADGEQFVLATLDGEFSLPCATEKDAWKGYAA